MNIGDLRHRVIIQKKSSILDSYGEPQNTWSDMCTVWAAVEPLTLGYKELLAAQEINSEVNVRVRIRYRSEITADMRVLYGTRIFDIIAPLDINGLHVEMHLMCKELTLDAG